jgi:hypothetical protein
LQRSAVAAGTHSPIMMQRGCNARSARRVKARVEMQHSPHRMRHDICNPKIMLVKNLTTSVAALIAKPLRAGLFTRRAALGSLAVMGCGHALAPLPAADPLVLVDGWLVKQSDIKPVILHQAP